MFAENTPADVTEKITSTALNSDVAHDTEVVAKWLMSIVHHILGWLNLDSNSIFASWIYVFLVFALSFAIGYAVKWLIVMLVNLIERHNKNDIYHYLYEWHFFSKLCRVIPPIFFLILIQFTLSTMHKTAIVLSRITYIYITIILTVSICQIIDATWTHINTNKNRKKLPLNGLVQLIKGILWIILIIIDVAIIADKSPASLFAGLGAFAAVLMLVFKDSILGLVAGVQLSENDSLHVGDWIKVSGTDANGVVQDVTLTTIKVLNWDKTTTTLPPYSLVSGSFTNYRTMQESNTRRIQRSWMVDADSIVPLDDALRQQISQVPYMADYFKSENAAETNLGAFRAYLELYLVANPNIDNESTHFVTTLAQTNGGVPLQLYCFTATSQWIPYENIQAEVFEHVAVAMAKFNLITFENASGRDSILEGYLGSRSPQGIMGVPYPFYLGENTPDDPGKPAASDAPSQK